MTVGWESISWVGSFQRIEDSKRIDTPEGTIRCGDHRDFRLQDHFSWLCELAAEGFSIMSFYEGNCGCIGKLRVRSVVL